MPKKIVARLADKSFVSIFTEDNPGFQSINEAYNIPHLNEENSFLFDPERKLEEDEWFFIQPTPDQINTILGPFEETIDNIDSINPISSEDYSYIRAICLVEKLGELNTLILTKIYPRFFTMSKKLLKWNDGPSIETQATSVEFTAKVDAFWNDGKLYFKSYSVIQSVFNGLEDFYRIATEDEKNEFISKNFFDCEVENLEVRPRNLRKIAAIMDSINWDDEIIQASYIAYANEYPYLGVQITDENKMKIESNKDLTNILNVLEERLYTTPITRQPREANTVTPLNRPLT
jgi:hypothetical protein